MSTTTDNFKEIQQQCREILGQDIADFIDSCNRGDHSDGMLISVLHKVQGKFGYLGPQHLNAVAQLTQIPTAKVTGVATFYHFFNLEKPGKFTISLCMGTACYVKGADKVAAKLSDELGIGFGETTSDGLFSLQQARCLGMCGLAPVMTVNEDTYDNVTADQIPGILEKYTKLKFK